MNGQWILTPGDIALILSKHRKNQLVFAILMVFFRDCGRFPRAESEVSSEGIAKVRRQLDISVPEDVESFFVGRTAERLRAEIRTRFGFRESTVADANMLTAWLSDHVAGEAGSDIDWMAERLELRCRELAIEPPATERVERIARAAIRMHEDQFHADVYSRLSPKTREFLDDLLLPAKGEENALEVDDISSSAPALLLKLKGNPGHPSLSSMQGELAKLKLIRRIGLPIDLFECASRRDIERCRRRVEVEAPHELRRHPDAARMTWLAAFVYLRSRNLTDDLVEIGRAHV